MRLGRYTQAPLERRRYFIDYSEWLDTNETLTGTPTLDVVEVTTPPLVIDGIVVSTDLRGFVFFVSGGVDSEEYQVDILVVTSGGQTKEDNILFTVTDPDL